MKVRILVFGLMALILFAAGAGAGKTCVDALKEGSIMSGGRRRSVLLDREREPNPFWITFTFNAVVCVGLVVGGAKLVHSAFRTPKPMVRR